jgi:hypothetical protein
VIGVLAITRVLQKRVAALPRGVAVDCDLHALGEVEKDLRRSARLDISRRRQRISRTQALNAHVVVVGQTSDKGNSMTDILLDVPFVTQVNIGGHVGAGNGRTEQMGCWYAAVSMLGYNREAGPRLGVPAQYVKPDGTPQGVDAKGNIQPLGMSNNYQTLVENEGLTLIPLPADKRWTCDKLAELLRDCGPCYMRTKIFGANGVFLGGHIIVLVGVKTTTNVVVVHDPARGPNIEMSIDDLNAKFNWDDTTVAKYSMMCKLPVPQTRARSNAVSLSAPQTRPRSNAISGR